MLYMFLIVDGNLIHVFYDPILLHIFARSADVFSRLFFRFILLQLSAIHFCYQICLHKCM